MSLTAWKRKAPEHACTEGDFGHTVEEILKDAHGTVVDLTGANVAYILHAPGATSDKVSAAATVVLPATNGQVKYTFTSGNTDTPGDYIERFRVTFSGGSVQYYPTEPHKYRVKDA